MVRTAVKAGSCPSSSTLWCVCPPSCRLHKTILPYINYLTRTGNGMILEIVTLETTTAATITTTTTGTHFVLSANLQN